MKKLSFLIFLFVFINLNKNIAQTASPQTPAPFGVGYDANIILTSPSVLTNWELQLTISGSATTSGAYVLFNGGLFPSSNYSQTGAILTINNNGLNGYDVPSTGNAIIGIRSITTETPSVVVNYFPSNGNNNTPPPVDQADIWQTGGGNSANLNPAITNLEINALTKIKASATQGGDVLQLHYPNLLPSGSNHYIFLANRFFTGSGFTNQMYGTIGAFSAHPSSTPQNLAEGPQPLILQAQHQQSNLGVGFHPNPPTAKLSIAAGSTIPSKSIAIVNNNNVDVFKVLNQGDIETRGNILMNKDNGRFLIHHGLDGSLFLAPNLGTTTDDWNWGVQLQFNKTGELIKRMADPSKRAIAVETNSGQDVFRVYGNGEILVLASDGTVNFRVKPDGKVFAREVKVTSANFFPDYVFAKDYKLMSLEDLSNFIQKNKHLPNIPTQNEVAKNGMDLGELTRLQQEKIEELTLYLIQMQKQINELKEQVISQK